jgi:hypothetical protein
MLQSMATYRYWGGTRAPSDGAGELPVPVASTSSMLAHLCTLCARSDTFAPLPVHIRQCTADLPAPMRLHQSPDDGVRAGKSDAEGGSSAYGLRLRPHKLSTPCAHLQRACKRTLSGSITVSRSISSVRRGEGGAKEDQKALGWYGQMNSAPASVELHRANVRDRLTRAQRAFVPTSATQPSPQSVGEGLRVGSGGQGVSADSPWHGRDLTHRHVGVTCSTAGCGDALHLARGEVRSAGVQLLIVQVNVYLVYAGWWDYESQSGVSERGHRVRG